MPNLVALYFIVSHKTDSQRYPFFFFSFFPHWQSVFEGIEFFPEFRRGPWENHFCEVSRKLDG